ncbi:MAG: efflux RND transporter permease subunit [Planctomycetaceae bacterium]|jgi:HAE1 family hydrophobic/amphiphilic exporter-1|nr:efflux RND transporter permease subunit [Planctomycetaceae bacterium]
MDIIKFSISNPVKIIVCVLLTLLFGAIALLTLPKQMTPDVDRPIVTVSTTWTGRSPEEVEKSVLMEQEKKLKTLQGLYQMTSTATLGRGQIELEFMVGYNITRAVQETSNRLDEVPDYPDDVERPIIRAASAQTDEAIGYGLIYAETDDPAFETAEFYDYADRYVKPMLERVRGIAQVDIFGGREHEVQVRFDPVAIAQMGISVSELREALRADNQNESAGDMANGRQNIRFRVLGRFDSLAKIRNTIIKYVGNTPIYVKDVANVHLSLQKRVNFDLSKGQPVMTVHFRRDVGENVLQVLTDVKKVMKTLQEPGGAFEQYKNNRYKIKMRMVYDDSTYISNAISVVIDNMYSGGILAVLVLLLFLRSFKPTIIVAVTIPISIFGTFIVMSVLGRSLNVISLAGLTFAVGMVIDCSIVVLENIDRHLSHGSKPLRAAYEGTREVWGGILASTLTTAAVFGPVLTIQEESGQLYYDIAVAISAAVLISLLTSVTVITAAASRWLSDPHRKRSRFTQINKSLYGLAPLCQLCSDKFSDFLYLLTMRTFSGIWLRTAIILVVSAAAIVISAAIMPPASYLPNGNKNGVFARFILPPGYSLQENTLIARRVEEQLKPYWDAKTVEEATAIAPVRDMRNGKLAEKVPPIDDIFLVVNTQSVFMTCTSKDPLLVQPLEVLLSNVTNSIPGAGGTGQQQSIFGRRGGGSNAVQIEVVGQDMNRLKESASYLEQRLIAEYSKAGVRTDPQNFDKSGPERQLVVDQVRAKQLGITVSSVAAAARAMIDGIVVGDFDYEGDNIDLTVIRDPSVLVVPDEIPTMPMSIIDSSGSAEIVPLGQLVSFVKADSSQQIRRVEQERAIRLTIMPPSDIALETAQARIMEIVDECRADGGMSPDIRTKLTGSANKLSQTREALMGKWTEFNFESFFSLITSRFFLSLLITYLLMAALFESFVYPFVIMFSVPFAIVGGFGGLACVRYYTPSQQMDTLTMLGFVILIGMVVNNAILLIHQTLNFMRGEEEGAMDEVFDMENPPGMEFREALREAVRTRIRPIFMTTATSVFGMMPLVFSGGAGSELYKGLGAVVVGGLACSAVFTMLIVPLMFSLAVDIQVGIRWLRRKWSRRNG